jgi:hypothetical protein
MERLGYPNTKAHSKVFRRDTSVFPERSKTFGLGSTTAAEMIRLCEALQKGELVSKEASEAMLKHMRACDDKDKFPRFLPPGTKVAFKTGSVDASKTAAGIIECGQGPVAVCVMTNENEDKRWVTDNAGNRLCAEVAGREGLPAVLDGFNADDRRDHRPGHRAAEERAIRSPLAEAGLTKAEVRAWSEAYRLPTWDKPQMACLASRLPYGTAVTVERLAQVERAEAALRALGLRAFRVRYHGEIGRVEVAAEELDTAFARRELLAAAVRGAGFKLAVLDLEPFRSGRLNELAGVLRVI